MKAIITLPPFYHWGFQTQSLAMDYCQCGKEDECKDCVLPIQDLVYGLVIMAPLELCSTCPAGERHTPVGKTMNLWHHGQEISMCPWLLQCTQWKLGHSSMLCPCSLQLVQYLAIIQSIGKVGGPLCSIGFLSIVHGDCGVILSMVLHLHKKYLCPPVWEEISDMWLSQNYE